MTNERIIQIDSVDAKRGNQFGHPVEVAAYLVGQFVEHLFLVKALVKHVKDDGCADNALVNDGLPVAVNVIARARMIVVRMIFCMSF